MNGTPATEPPPRATESERERVEQRLNARGHQQRRPRTINVGAPSFLGSLLDDVRCFFRFLRDPHARMPGETKLILFIAAAYVLMPLDFLPDAIPGLGVVDDALVIGMVISGLRSMLDGYRRLKKEQ